MLEVPILVLLALRSTDVKNAQMRTHVSNVEVDFSSIRQANVSSVKQVAANVIHLVTVLHAHLDSI